MPEDHKAACWVGGRDGQGSTLILGFHATLEAGQPRGGTDQEILSLHLAANSWDRMITSSWRRCSCVPVSSRVGDFGNVLIGSQCFLDRDWWMPEELGLSGVGRGMVNVVLCGLANLLLLLLLRLQLLQLPGLDPGGEMSQDGKRTKCA